VGRFAPFEGSKKGDALRRTAIVLIAMALGVSSCADEPQALTTTSPMAEPEASSSTEATTTTSSTSTSATTTTAAPPIYGTLFRSADEYPEATFVTMLGSGPGSCSALEDTACVIRHTVPAGREVVATVGLVNSDRSALLEDLDVEPGERWRCL
jgi:hypothetical protein